VRPIPRTAPNAGVAAAPGAIYLAISPIPATPDAPMRLRTGILLAAAALLCGCLGKSTSSPSPVTRYEIGTARESQFMPEVPRLLSRLSFVVQRTDETPSLIRWVTQTRRRPVLDDETGVQEAELNLVIVARKGRSSPRGDIFNMELQVESLVRIHPDSAWTAVRPTPMYNRYMDRFVQEFRTIFDTGEHLLR
jgi:hypothetical protein